MRWLHVGMAGESPALLRVIYATHYYRSTYVDISTPEVTRNSTIRAYAGFWPGNCLTTIHPLEYWRELEVLDDLLALRHKTVSNEERSWKQQKLI